MLTTDLVRTRIRDGQVEPLYLDPDDATAQSKAEKLVDIFERGLEERRERQEIEDEVQKVVGYGTDYRIWRGLAKLLDDRSDFETVAAAEPAEIRRVTFGLAAKADAGAGDDEGQRGPKWRESMLEEAAEELDIEPEEVDRGLYADLDERQRLVDFDAIDPQELLHRYNLALAQAVLYKATHLRVELRDLNPNMLRYLFQVLKFNRLMHRVERKDDGRSGETSYAMTIDGPASLFKRNRKYGLHMAKFLPALVLAEDWRMEATLDWEDQELEFVLSSDEGLESHYTARAQWVADEEKHFEKRFDEIDPEWELERRGTILGLEDNEVIVPDYVVRHPEDGREAYLEIVGFWRMSYLKRRIEMLRRQTDLPLILAVSERLKTGREQLEESPAAVFFFKSVILVDNVVEAADEVAIEAGVKDWTKEGV